MRWFLGVALLFALALHAYLKGPALLPEIFWSCHVFSSLLAVGLFLDSPRISAVGLAFHVAIGFPGYILDTLALGTTTVMSLVVHLLPLGIGAYAARRGGVPRGVVLPAWALYVAMVGLSRLITPPALNVNLSHAPWPPMAGRLPEWVLWLWNLFAPIAFLSAATWLLRRLFGAGARDERRAA